MSEIIVAIIAGLFTLALAGFGLLGARKYNIGPNQDKLVSTLKDLVAAQQIRIEQLENQSLESSRQVEALRTEVGKLTALTIKQALKISELESKSKGGPNEG
jgi:hypothetical protein